jgi:hypothetical protein
MFSQIRKKHERREDKEMHALYDRWEVTDAVNEIRETSDISL